MGCEYCSLTKGAISFQQTGSADNDIQREANTDLFYLNWSVAVSLSRCY